MPEFGLYIAAMDSVVLGGDSPLFHLLFRAKILDSHPKHRETDSEGVLNYIRLDFFLPGTACSPAIWCAELSTNEASPAQGS